MVGSVMLEENVRGFPASGRFIPEFWHHVHQNPLHICCNIPDDVSKLNHFFTLNNIIPFSFWNALSYNSVHDFSVFNMTCYTSALVGTVTAPLLRGTTEGKKELS